ncbi:MAG: hypothetical protein IPK82_27155 [Polyangiaceae bacterium]|nr:hypothetical protein [Polyangiaceae bacterium]
MAGESTLLVQEFFESGDSRFMDELLRSTAAKKLKALADRWYTDPRPFARDALLVYIDDGCDRPHHRPLVKALLKKAEAAADDEALAHFVVAFDRLIVRKIVTVAGWNYQTKTSTKSAHISGDKRFGAAAKTDLQPHFSLRTRRYLQRRAVRYFRKIAKTDLARYGRGVRLVTSLYRDENLDSAQKLLDSWGLLHILYGRSPVLSRVPRGIVLAPSRALGELTPAPIYPSAWKNCLGDLVTLLKKARSYTVRSFVLTLLQTEYASQLGTIAPLRLRALLLSPHEEVQNFAANLLKNARDIHLLPVADWLDLLKVESPTALETVCELVKKHVSPGRLTLAECVALGCQRPAPVAELGLAWARSKKLSTEADLVTLLAFSKAECAKVRAEAATFVKDVLQKSLATRPEHVRDFLDSRYSDVRGAAFDLMTHDPRFRDAALLWSALAESPYDDVRTFLLRHVQTRGEKAHPGSLTAVWSTVLLGIARGSRTKRRALGQVAHEVASHPEKADELLPLLGVALRSVRPPERRAAVSAVAQAAANSPALTAAITRRLPEIIIKPEVVR